MSEPQPGFCDKAISYRRTNQIHNWKESQDKRQASCSLSLLPKYHKYDISLGDTVNGNDCGFAL